MLTQLCMQPNIFCPVPPSAHYRSTPTLRNQCRVVKSMGLKSVRPQVVMKGNAARFWQGILVTSGHQKSPFAVCDENPRFKMRKLSSVRNLEVERLKSAQAFCLIWSDLHSHVGSLTPVWRVDCHPTAVEFLGPSLQKVCYARINLTLGKKITEVAFLLLKALEIIWHQLLASWILDLPWII